MHSKIQLRNKMIFCRSPSFYQDTNVKKTLRFVINATIAVEMVLEDRKNVLTISYFQIHQNEIFLKFSNKNSAYSKKY